MNKKEAIKTYIYKVHGTTNLYLNLEPTKFYKCISKMDLHSLGNLAYHCIGKQEQKDLSFPVLRQITLIISKNSLSATEAINKGRYSSAYSEQIFFF